MEQKKDKKILVYGYGNPGRQDDALANEMIEKISDWIDKKGIQNVSFDSNYQLNVEDAEVISHYDLVIFVDASIEEINDFILTKVYSSDAKIEFSMHAVSCSYVLDLCNSMYNAKPETYLLHIKGYEWEFLEEMTEDAKANLEKAFHFLCEILADIDSIETKISS
jgi:hydrogenase maturation protease